MKTGKSISELGVELARQASVKQDLLAPASALMIRSNGHSDLILGPEKAYAVNDLAHQQIAQYLDFPKAFYDRLRGSSHELTVDVPGPLLGRSEPLFDVVVNRLLGQKGEDKRLVRLLDGNVRALLSDSFSLDLDNYDVFQAAAAAIQASDLDADCICSCEVTERKLYLKVASPRLEAVIHPSNLKDAHGWLKQPQTVQAAFVLQNSEVGFGTFSISQAIINQVCANMAVVEEAYKRRHVGRVLEAGDGGIVYSNETRQAEAKLQLLRVRDHVREALSETRFRALVGRMQETTEIPLKKEVEKVIDITQKKYGLTTAERNDTLANLIEGADLSLWGLSNALTATAQQVESYDRATELETIGGSIFHWTKEEIREVAQG